MKEVESANGKNLKLGGGMMTTMSANSGGFRTKREVVIKYQQRRGLLRRTATSSPREIDRIIIEVDE